MHIVKNYNYIHFLKDKGGKWYLEGCSYMFNQPK
jgi:hypothetical protein